MNILSIDTTGATGSLALYSLDTQQLLGQVAIDGPDGYAHLLFGEVEALMSRHQRTFDDIACYAAAAGPGSFTGVRVGLTAVKGLAEATGKPVIAVSNLAALAWHGTGALRAPVMDARRGDVFGAVYDEGLNLVRDEVVMKFAEWLDQVPEGAELIMSGIVDAPGHDVVSAPLRLAGAVASIAARLYADGFAQDPAAIDANYVRRSDAELMWRDIK